VPRVEWAVWIGTKPKLYIQFLTYLLLTDSLTVNKLTQDSCKGWLGSLNNLSKTDSSGTIRKDRRGVGSHRAKRDW